MTVDDGQPWQLPSSRSRATPSRHAEVLHTPGVRAEVGANLVEGALDPGVHVQRVQVVQQQEALHQRVLGQAVEHRGARRAILLERGHDVLQPVAVEADQQPDQFLGHRGRVTRVARAQRDEQFLDPRADVSHAAHAPLPPSAGPSAILTGTVIGPPLCRRPGQAVELGRPGSPGPAQGPHVDNVTVIGECTLSSILPLPRYMCTPQGRHGSKLRTARMMSMPLNDSGGFSSKIGVFCTASS